MSETLTATQTERKSKWFWAVDDCWNVVQVLGYECPPNDRVWWVPAFGYSMTEEFHLFDTRRAAKQKAIETLEGKIVGLQSALSKLQKEK